MFYLDFISYFKVVGQGIIENLRKKNGIKRVIYKFILVQRFGVQNEVYESQFQ